MKIIKPLRLGILSRVYEIGVKPYLVVTSLAYFPLSRPDVLLGEQSLWTTFAKEAGDAAPKISIDGSAPNYAAPMILDEGLPKARGEVLVRGFAFTQGGPQRGCAVKVELGPEGAPLVSKSLVVTGDRRWDFMGQQMPEPFEKMPIDWEHAFGGPSLPENPVGKGLVSAPGPDGKPVTVLPNVEYPNDRIKVKGDRPRPASFGPMDPSWQVRLSKMGTFDKKWLDTEYPGMPSDLDLEAFNTAPVDQRIKGHWRGGERFLIEGMHPQKPVLEGTLPTFRARSFVLAKGADTKELKEVPMRLETVQLWPHLERGLLVFRGIVPIQEDDGWDVGHLMIAAEKAGEARDLPHYQAVLAERLDPEKGAAVALRDRDLLPAIPKWKDDADPVDEMMSLVRREQLLQKNMDKKDLRDHQKLIDEMRAAGLAPETQGFTLAPPTPIAAEPIELEDIADVEERLEREAEEEQKKADVQMRDAEERGRALAREHGVDPDDMKGQGAGGPPKFSADDELRELREAVASAHEVGVELPGLTEQANDPAFERMLRDQEAQLKDLYRDSAHIMPPVLDPTPDDAEQLGRAVLAAHAEREPVADRDFSGAMLAGANLEGADLRFGFLEKARLEKARLANADLHRVVLARADLRGADLRGATLTGANLGEADLSGADLSGADLSNANLFRCKLHGTKLDGATLVELEAWELDLKDASLAGATVGQTNFTRVVFDGARAVGATFEEVMFVQSKVPRLDLSDATVAELSFVATQGPGSTFRGAKLKGFSMLGECAFPRADFTGAQMRGAALRGTDLEGSTFDDADLEGADFSECQARGSSFRRVVGTEAIFVRTDLTDADVRESKLLDAIAQKARLGGARFDGSKLFGADLAGARGDDRTSFSGADLRRVRQTRRSS